MSNETKGPQPPAEAQGGGDAELRHMVAKLAAHVRPTCGELWAEAERLLNRTAPPSAPVGAAEEMVLDAIERRGSSAPVGVESVEAALQKWLDWCNEHNEEPEAKSGARIAIEALAQQPAAVGGTARRRDVRLWMRHNAGSYSTATELAEAADDVFRLPDGALDNETHWVWDEAVEAVYDSQRGGLA